MTGYIWGGFVCCRVAAFIRSSPIKVPSSRHILLLEYFDEYISVGGYPEAVKAYESGESPYKVMDEIIASPAEDFQRKEE